MTSIRSIYIRAVEQDKHPDQQSETLHGVPAVWGHLAYDCDAIRPLLARQNERS